MLSHAYGRPVIFICYRPVAPVLRKILFPCLPPTSGGKTGILRNKGVTWVCNYLFPLSIVPCALLVPNKKDFYESLCQCITKWTWLKWNCKLFFPPWPHILNIESIFCLWLFLGEFIHQFLSFF